MGEDISPTSDSKKSPEMTPQDDGTKVPLTNDAPPVCIEEAKYASNPNGDAKIDVGVAPVFSGLTKDELMKYSTDPFWVRVRWSLFILFWLGWLAMLIMAVVIIVQAPGCKPPPELLWVEENALLEVDRNNLPSEADLIQKCKVMGLSLVYFPHLISTKDFEIPNYDATTLIEALEKEGYNAVTDIPARVDPSNPFYPNATEENLILSDGTWNYHRVDFTNYTLPSAIFREIVEVWMVRGVKGFILVEDKAPWDRRIFMNYVNELAKEQGGAVSEFIMETQNELESPAVFKSFIEEQSRRLNIFDENWNFYRFNPKQASGSSVSEAQMRLYTIGLFMIPGSPMLNNYMALSSNETELIKELIALKAEKAIKFGSTFVVNTTSPDVIAFTRVYKGTPAFAVALNFNGGNETISFAETENVGETGTSELLSNESQNIYGTSDKYQLNEINLGPFEGLILQFVAKF